MTSRTLIVFSHLRWEFVYQRPQHLLSRLAGRWRVIYIEEPVVCSGPPFLEVQKLHRELTVVVPHTPVAAPGFHDDQLALLEPMMSEHLKDFAPDQAVVWLYTPMALPLIAALRPRCVVYDCMDELSAFKDAPRQLRQRETALLKQASVVFTGGPSLYDAKAPLHLNVHCLPSSVDAAHFAVNNLVSGSAEDLLAIDLQGHLKGPKLGFFGVLDERLDIDLIAALADAHPEWHIVMAGPVVKIHPDSLPQRTNIHWLGIQPYAVLPYLLESWEIGLIPFLLNESTRYISPTKTLEYMAGDTPVVSTPIKDVVTLFGNAVKIANGSVEFIAACEDMLAEPGPRRHLRAVEMVNMVSSYSWDRTADRMHRLISDAWQQAAGDVEHGGAVALSLRFAEVADDIRVAASGGI